jgi:hypothetical protein
MIPNASIMIVELDRAVAQAVSRRPVRPVPVGFVADRVTAAQVYLQVLRFSPVRIIPPVLHTHSSTTNAIWG